MSKWRKALKNNKRFDARYFLNERVENQETIENSVQQEQVKRNFNDFSFDSWLTEAEEAIEEMHCNSKRDDENKEKKLEEEELEEMHCNSKRDDENPDKNMEEEKLKNPKKADLNKDGKLSPYEEKRGNAIEKAMQKKAAKEDIEELQVHPHTAKDFSGAVVPIKDEEPPVKKKEDPDLMRRSRVKQMKANAEARRNKSKPVQSES